ncbi:tRNA (adenine(22)-N(1))-methyltransferase TrmK [Ornithinibacillus sp. L9]|uniref:tRNA (Adenine(22)-N(1))-methyltransferase TrmK n=1 Tax=Ornithinibacillus caprae TaxID=2678566 RepID=A0A6N8FCM0_9BACI|nr:tRNA (adenine(22)-N(1))-methyltransferase TrmK [Ornithinibacillus caprae]MUK87105.1 tRNA (adenine(22)-N(1))-methyltransferase TrmK [Ornithinibacillus caprae]
MEESIKLSKRLSIVASYLPSGAVFADIGSDHAYLPCFVCSNDNEARAIAGEVNVGPYESAKETVNYYQLNDVVDVRLGNGLEVVTPGEVEQVVIAGMGGALIKSILEEGVDNLKNAKRIIAQPNVDEKNVRTWLTTNDYVISHEAITEENGHIYEIIVADRYKNGKQLTEMEILFGPELLKSKPSEFYQKWKLEREKRLRVIEQLNQAKIPPKEKIYQFEHELKMIEEVLMDEKTID